MLVITLLSIITALLVVTSTSTVYSVLWLVSTFLIISALLGFLNLGFAALLYIIVYVGAIAILFLFVVQLLDLGSVSEQPDPSRQSHQQEGRPHWSISEVQHADVGQDNKSIYQLTDVSSNTSTKGITPLAIVISVALLSILVSVTVVSGFGSSTILLSDSVINTNAQGLQTLFYNGSSIDISSLLCTKLDTANSTLLLPSSFVASTQGGTPQIQSIAEWFYGPGALPLVIISIILLVAMIAPISLCKDND